jgi:chromosome segregation ATPase
MVSSEVLSALRAGQTRVAELEAEQTGYELALNRAERDQAADRDTIAALRSAVAKLRADVRAAALEHESAKARLAGAMEEQKRRAMEVVRSAEASRGQLVCEKAAAEHDRDEARCFLPADHPVALNGVSSCEFKVRCPLRIAFWLIYCQHENYR